MRKFSSATLEFLFHNIRECIKETGLTAKEAHKALMGFYDGYKTENLVSYRETEWDNSFQEYEHYTIGIKVVGPKGEYYPY